MALVRTIAGQALEVSFADIPDTEIHQVKRLLLDSLACAVGGRDSAVADALIDSLALLGGPTGEAGIFTFPAKVSALNAILVNGAMLRYLDMNDVQSRKAGTAGQGFGHNSEIFPTVLALGQRQHLSGRETIVNAWIGYEVATRFLESIQGPTLEERGWAGDLRATLVTPIVAGRILRLDAQVIENAVGTSLSRGTLLAVVDHHAETNSMAKNLRYPLGAHLGVLSTYLASAGLAGPTRALEGGGGFIESVLGGDFDVDHMVNGDWGARVLNAGMKRFAACFAEHGHLAATLSLINEFGIRAGDIEAVHVVTTTRGARHTGDPSRRHPTDKETADHSSYYVQAALLVDRELGPGQYTPDKLTDQEINRIADLVSIEGDPGFDDVYPSARVQLRTRDGHSYERYVGYPPGHASNPLSDREIEDKFRSLANPWISETNMDRCIDMVWNLDSCADIGALMDLLTS
jgi:2-methylcitrate dehydratase